jgi:hypothetical protein
VGRVRAWRGARCGGRMREQMLSGGRGGARTPRQNRRHAVVHARGRALSGRPA